MYLGIYIAVGTFVLLAAIYLNSALKRRRAGKFIQTTGREARARMLSVNDTGVTVNNNPRVRMTIQVEAPSLEPYTITKSATVSRIAIPRAGEVYRAFYDPADLNHVVIELGNALPSESATASPPVQPA